MVPSILRAKMHASPSSPDAGCSNPNKNPREITLLEGLQRVFKQASTCSSLIIHSLWRAFLAYRVVEHT
ncbi:unnamed protein product [Prunus armeniaca]|uniref:Uncharacterized protein n=1 Tax=Prunus armeniaca TaxID=36596 RepID=A0A6J5XZT3_PRUAR|nr:unnamed protein product [Prunus armeniaca]